MISIDWNPDHTRLRQFAVIWWVGFTGLGVLAGLRPYLDLGHPGNLAIVLAAAGAVVGLTGLVVPGAVKPVYLAWMGVAFPVGWVLSHLLLGILYYGLFTVVGLVMRAWGRDALRLRQPPEDGSLWVRRRDHRPPESYFRQF